MISKQEFLNNLEAANFVRTRQSPTENVVCQLDQAAKQKMSDNREKLKPLLSTVIYYWTHDISLRGKDSTSGNFHDLLDFRIEAGDKILEDHLKFSPKNARYVSSRIQNELISFCEQVVREEIVKEVNDSVGFSIIADETADIGGIEQLSLAVRYVHKKEVKEQFLGFVPLSEMNAEAIADKIIDTLSSFNVNLDKILGQGYDGCSTMAGKDNGVQARIRKKYPKAFFTHCSSHRLNLVINDLNAVMEVRNTVGTVKAIINFFRDSPKRRKLVPNIPLLSETRWSEKHKALRLFRENFELLFQTLFDLSNSTESVSTRQSAHQLAHASGNGIFIATLIIAKYSAILEPVTQALQAVSMDILGATNQIHNLLNQFKQHRTNAECFFKNEIFSNIQNTAEALGIELNLPRQCGRQAHRTNIIGNTFEEYVIRSIFIPYLDSVICSLETRFSDDSWPQRHLFTLHPLHMKKCNRDKFKDAINCIERAYNIENLKEEAMSWFDFWEKNNDIPRQIVDLLVHTEFYPSINYALLIALTLPVTSCTVERSFSNLRRVKTWIRSTMSNERLSGLCMMSVHRERINREKNKLCLESSR